MYGENINKIIIYVTIKTIFVIESSNNTMNKIKGNEIKTRFIIKVTEKYARIFFNDKFLIPFIKSYLILRK